MNTGANVVLGVLVGLLLSACSGGEASPVAIYEGEWNASDAVVVGTLTREGECLYVVDPVGYSPAGSGGKLLVAFGPGTDWNGESQTVSYFGRHLRVGDLVEIGGSSPVSAAGRFSWIDAPADTCNSAVMWFASQPSPR